VYRIEPVFACDFQLDPYSQGCSTSQLEHQQVLRFELLGYNRTVFITGGYQGDLAATLDLNRAALNEFSRTGALPFESDVRSGDKALTAATLTIQHCGSARACHSCAVAGWMGDDRSRFPARQADQNRTPAAALAFVRSTGRFGHGAPRLTGVQARNSTGGVP
jgi:hypothetical protein